MTCQPDHATVDCPECGTDHPFPREPSAYRPTDHFLQRKRDRDPPAGAIADCIREGTPNASHKPLCRCFDATVHGEQWRVVVRFDPQVVHGPATKHRAVTICPVEE